jgi:uncharacterized SAM-binding protein YcdF (DUF218 family)
MSAGAETLAEVKPVIMTPAETAVKKPRKFLSRAVRWLLVFGLLIVLGWVFRATLMKQFAELWIVDERLQRADAIVVLGGGASSRPGEAARLYHQGYASQVVVMVSGTKPPGEETVPVAADKLALVGSAVPESAVVTLDQRVTSTYDEAKAVYAWAATSGVKRVIIPSDMFHTRRMHWIFQKTLRPLNIDVVVTAIPAKSYSTSNWWKSEEGFLTLNNEVVKLIYYRLNY